MIIKQKPWLATMIHIQHLYNLQKTLTQGTYRTAKYKIKQWTKRGKRKIYTGSFNLIRNFVVHFKLKIGKTSLDPWIVSTFAIIFLNLKKSQFSVSVFQFFTAFATDTCESCNKSRYRHEIQKLLCFIFFFITSREHFSLLPNE